MKAVPVLKSLIAGLVCSLAIPFAYTTIRTIATPTVATAEPSTASPLLAQLTNGLTNKLNTGGQPSSTLRSFPRDPRAARITRVIARNLGTPTDVGLSGYNCLVTDTNRGRLIVLTGTTTGCTSQIRKTYPGLVSPYGVARSGRSHYITEVQTKTFKRINAQTGSISTLGTFEVAIGRITGSESGSIYIPSDSFMCGGCWYVTRYDPLTNRFDVIFDGRGGNIQPTDVAFINNLFLVTGLKSNGCLYRAEPNGPHTTIACNLGQPQSIAVVNGSYIVSDANGRLLRVSSTGRVTTLLSRGLGSPGGMLVQRGKLLVTDMTGGRLLEVTL
uniref:NHL repeat containing protein n=1 Tax=Cyanothece sp. (strain PCC 7425 / ATCC 29141) TaxID=395961 RepID=B8HS78_CYAP4